jgi:hypothetical protein
MKLARGLVRTRPKGHCPVPIRVQRTLGCNNCPLKGQSSFVVLTIISMISIGGVILDL